MGTQVMVPTILKCVPNVLILVQHVLKMIQPGILIFALLVLLTIHFYGWIIKLVLLVVLKELIKAIKMNAQTV